MLQIFMSMVQYVDRLYGSRMEGEEAYNWTQLNTAVAFIKMWLQESLMLDDKVFSLRLFVPYFRNIIFAVAL